MTLPGDPFEAAGNRMEAVNTFLRRGGWVKGVDQISALDTTHIVEAVDRDCLASMGVGPDFEPLPDSGPGAWPITVREEMERRYPPKIYPRLLSGKDMLARPNREDRWQAD